MTQNPQQLLDRSVDSQRLAEANSILSSYSAPCARCNSKKIVKVVIMIVETETSAVGADTEMISPKLHSQTPNAVKSYGIDADTAFSGAEIDKGAGDTSELATQVSGGTLCDKFVVCNKAGAENAASCIPDGAMCRLWIIGHGKEGEDGISNNGNLDIDSAFIDGMLGKKRRTSGCGCTVEVESCLVERRERQRSNYQRNGRKRVFLAAI